MKHRFRKAQLLGGACLFLATLFASAQSQTPAQDQHRLSYGLLIDNSGSLRYAIDVVVSTAKRIVGNNQSSDETFVVLFTSRDNIKRLENFTRDKAALADAIDTIYPEGGQTAILDALYQSAEYLSQNAANDAPARQRALIVISDGENRESKRFLSDVLHLCLEKNIRIYVIAFIAQLQKDRGKKTSEKAASLMTQLATETGGKAFFPRNTTELNQASDEIFNVMRLRESP